MFVVERKKKKTYLNFKKVEDIYSSYLTRSPMYPPPQDNVSIEPLLKISLWISTFEFAYPKWLRTPSQKSNSDQVTSSIIESHDHHPNNTFSALKYKIRDEHPTTHVEKPTNTPPRQYAPQFRKDQYTSHSTFPSFQISSHISWENPLIKPSLLP